MCLCDSRAPHTTGRQSAADQVAKKPHGRNEGVLSHEEARGPKAAVTALRQPTRGACARGGSPPRPPVTVRGAAVTARSVTAAARRVRATASSGDCAHHVTGVDGIFPARSSQSKECPAAAPVPSGPPGPTFIPWGWGFIPSRSSNAADGSPPAKYTPCVPETSNAGEPRLGLPGRRNHANLDRIVTCTNRSIDQFVARILSVSDFWRQRMYGGDFSGPGCWSMGAGMGVLDWTHLAPCKLLYYILYC